MLSAASATAMCLLAKNQCQKPAGKLQLGRLDIAVHAEQVARVITSYSIHYTKLYEVIKLREAAALTCALLPVEHGGEDIGGEAL